VIAVLQDPSVATSPIDKRIAFLQSKNLTQEEIDLSLARAGDDPSAGSITPSSTQTPPSYSNYRQQSPPPPGYGYPQQPYWAQPPPPEPPKRDWRDWFIMATVLGGVSYGLYFTAKRYIVPLIAPPTPPQLEQDKSAVDEQFQKAFALLDQLSTDTTTLKSTEEQRTQRLDTALNELEAVLSSLKDSDRRRDDDARRTADEVRGLRDLIPRAMDAQKESNEQRLRELGTELKSLKTLVGNRVGTAARPGEPAQNAANLRPGYLGGSGNGMNGGAVSPGPSPSTPVQQPGTPTTDGQQQQQQQAGAQDQTQINGTETPQLQQPRPQSASLPYGRNAGGKAAIPAWQMAASKKAQDSAGAVNGTAGDKKDTSESGTVSEATAA